MNVTGVLIGEPFTLKYHQKAGPLDFLVLRQNYDLSLHRNWQPGERFRAIVGDCWWKDIWKRLNLSAMIVPPPISSAVVLGEIPICLLAKIGGFN